MLPPKPASRRQSGDNDPVMLGFLRFLSKQMADHPETVKPVDANQMRGIGKLVKGVK